MRFLIEIVSLLIAAAIGAAVSLVVLAMILLGLPGPAGVLRSPMGGTVLWTAFVIAGTAFWPFVAAAGASRLIAGALDHPRDWRRTGLYAAGLMGAITGWMSVIGATGGLMFAAAAVAGGGVAGAAATLLVNRATTRRAN